MSGSRRFWSGLEWGLIVLGSVLLFSRTPGFGPDGEKRYQALAQFLEEGTFSDVKYSLVGPLFATPFFYLSQWLQDPTWCARFNQAVFAGALVCFWLLMRPHVAPGVSRKFLLLLIAGTMFSRSLQAFYAEVFTGLSVAVGLIVLARGSPKAGGILAAVGVANAPATIVGLGVVALQKIWEDKKLRYGLLVVAPIAIVIAESWIRHGGPFENPYEKDAGYRTLLPYSGLPGFSYPFFFGLLSIFFSFGKGLLFFCPGLLLVLPALKGALSPTIARALRYWLGFTVGLVLVYAKWWSWYGGWAWGPRFFLFASIPASLGLAILLDGWRGFRPGLAGLAVVCLALSLWVSVSGAVFPMDELAIGYVERYRYEAFCWYVPEFSPLWYPFVSPHTEWERYVIPCLYAGIVFVVLAGGILVAAVRLGWQRVVGVFRGITRLRF